MAYSRIAIALVGALCVSPLGPPPGLAPVAFSAPLPQAAKAAGPRVVAIGMLDVDDYLSPLGNGTSTPEPPAEPVDDYQSPLGGSR